MNGQGDGGNIGFWVGWFIGNPIASKTIGKIVGGLLVGAAYSVIASYGIKEAETAKAEELNNWSIFLLIMMAL